MPDLRSINTDRPWDPDCNGGEEEFRRDVEEALKNGERVTLIWSSRAGGTDDYDQEISYTQIRRKPARQSKMEHVGCVLRTALKWMTDDD